MSRALLTYRFMLTMWILGLTSNALSSVGGWIGLFMLVFMGWLSDKTRLRGPVVTLAIAILLTWWITFQQVSTSDKRWLKYAFLVLTHGFGQAYHVSRPASVCPPALVSMLTEHSPSMPLGSRSTVRRLKNDLSAWPCVSRPNFPDLPLRR